MSLVEFERSLDAGRLILNRPEAGNAISSDLIDDFARGVDSACEAPIRALLISARGANFSLGGDVRQLAAAGSNLADTLEDMATRFHLAQRRLAGLPIPIVACVRGTAIGGGLGLVLSADFMICADTARFSTGYARLGLSADAGVSYFLTRALGARRATALLIDARFISADEAVSLGVADRIVPDSELDVAAETWVEELAAGPTAAFAAIKRLTEEARSNSLERHLDREAEEIVALARRPYTAAAIAAIVDRRRPVFD